MQFKTLAFDLDGTLCSNTEGAYETATPIIKNIAKVNRLFDEGNIIVIYTARGCKTGRDLRKFTEQQLKAWGVKHHHLFLGKPFADLFVDDKAVNSNDFFKED